MSSGPSTDYAAIVAQTRALREAGASVDEAIAALRALNASPIDAIKSVRDVYAVSLGDAKHGLHQSPAWSDLRPSFEQLHDDANVIARDLNQNSE